MQLFSFDFEWEEINLKQEMQSVFTRLNQPNQFY